MSIDASPSYRWQVIQNMIMDHYLALLESPVYARSLIRVYIEANMSHLSADHVATMLKSDPRLRGLDICRDYDRKGRVGITTTNESKRRIAMELRRAAPTMQRAETFISTSAEFGRPVTQHWSALLDQLGWFRETILAPNNPDQNTAVCNRVTYGGKSAGKKDDLVMAAGIATLYAVRDVNENNAFRNACEGKRLTMFCS